MKLKRFLLRYYPPGIILEYEQGEPIPENGGRRRVRTKVIDLLDLEDSSAEMTACCLSAARRWMPPTSADTPRCCRHASGDRNALYSCCSSSRLTRAPQRQTQTAQTLLAARWHVHVATPGFKHPARATLEST